MANFTYTGECCCSSQIVQLTQQLGTFDTVIYVVSKVLQCLSKYQAIVPVCHCQVVSFVSIQACPLSFQILTIFTIHIPVGLYIFILFSPTVCTMQFAYQQSFILLQINYVLSHLSEFYSLVYLKNRILLFNKERNSVNQAKPE